MCAKNIPTSNRLKSIAVHRLHLPDGTVLPMQVIDFDSAGTPIAYHALCGEEAFTEWRGGDFYWGGQ